MKQHERDAQELLNEMEQLELKAYRIASDKGDEELMDILSRMDELVSEIRWSHYHAGYEDGKKGSERGSWS